MKESHISIQQGTPQDIPALFSLIQGLAEYEKAPHEVTNTVEQLHQDAFGEQPLFGFWMAYEGGLPVGMAMYYYRYSSWKGKCLYLEDLYVLESYRKRKVGIELFKAIVRQARQDQCKRISWQVLDWNQPAIDFYKKLDASFDAGWVNCALDHHQIAYFPA